MRTVASSIITSVLTCHRCISLLINDIIQCISKQDIVIFVLIQVSDTVSSQKSSTRLYQVEYRYILDILYSLIVYM